MKTDRELLEFAAKAYFSDGPTHISGDGFMDWVRDCRGQFNPLINDGDALRLAVKLILTIDRGDCCCCVNVIHGLDCEEFELVSERMNEADGPSLQDPYAATRRAIVRAAAEIGKIK